jgi:hypothetical protein
MTLSDLGGVWVNEQQKYRLLVRPSEYLMVHIGVRVEDKLFGYEHANVASSVPKVFHKKLSNPKRWVGIPGREFGFVVRLDRIELVEEVFHTFPKVRIGGQEFHLNVSGGTENKWWVDWVGEAESVGMGARKKHLKALEEVSEWPDGCGRLMRSGFRLDVAGASRDDLSSWRLAAAEKVVPGLLRPGMELFTASGDGPHPFVRTEGRGKVRCARVTGRPDQFDLLRAAKAYDLPLPAETQFNRVGGLTEAE